MIVAERLNDIFHISEVIKHQQFMSSRQARELPKIDIGGTMFYLDLRLNEFRECENFMNRLSINDLNEYQRGYLVCFDPKTKNYFQGGSEEFEKRKDTELIWEKLPPLQEMDPLGYQWLMEEIREGSTIMDPNKYEKLHYESETAPLERVLDKAGLLFKVKGHPPLLEKKNMTKSKSKKL